MNEKVDARGSVKSLTLVANGVQVGPAKLQTSTFSEPVVRREQVKSSEACY